MVCRRGGVAVDQDNRTPPALLDIAQIHPVTGAKRGHKISSRRAGRGYSTITAQQLFVRP
jgi:hypothetical protein